MASWLLVYRSQYIHYYSCNVLYVNVLVIIYYMYLYRRQREERWLQMTDLLLCKRTLPGQSEERLAQMKPA